MVRYGAADGSLASAIVAAVAEATGADPATVGPLNEVIDTDALERLFSPLRDPAAGPRTGTVTFRFEGCRVTVHADGRVVARTVGDDGG